MIETFITWWRDRQHLFGGVARSSQWPKVRRAFIAKNPLCAVCKRKGTLLNPNEVHHIAVFHKDPSRELDPTNFLTLCRPHHHEWGHYFSWKSWNQNVVEDVSNFRIKVENRP